MSNGGEMRCPYPEIALRRLEGATVFATSDFVLTQEGAVWDKYHFPQFTKAIPLDRDLAGYGGGRLLVRGMGRSQVRHRVGPALSLCGVQARIWSHFLFQYLPKLAALDAALRDAQGTLTLLVPRYDDAHVRHVVAEVTKGYNGLTILELARDEAVACEVLYHLPHASHLADHALYISIYDSVIPGFAMRAVKDLLPNPAAGNREQADEGSKIYLVRRGARSPRNVEQIEQFFLARGFRPVEPHKLSYNEKARTFAAADAVAGPFSSGFTNLAFCRPGTKALILANLQRSFDFMGLFALGFGADILMVTGEDYGSDPHSAYEIHLDRLEEAFSRLAL
jgi:hypothetical protein